VKKTLKELAEYVGGTLTGDENKLIDGAMGLNSVKESEITFAVEPYFELAEKSAAGAVIIPDTLEHFGKDAIRVKNPREAFTKMLVLFAPKLNIERGIHPTAVIGKNVKLGENTAIMAYAVIADDAVIGDNTIIYPHTYIGQGAAIGCDAIIYPNVTVREFCKIGDRVIINSGAAIGSDGFGFVTVDGRHTKVPQVGIVILEDDVEIGANVGIDRATTDATIVRRGTKVDNLVHLAHNVEIGENGLIVALTGIAGSTKVGHNVTFAGQCGCVGHINIGNNIVFAARSAPTNDVPDNSFYAGFPARPHKEWLRMKAAQARGADTARLVRSLEKKINELEARLDKKD
jgi:UDP-3-O-[3-hydroxymyristoyl] glucosamine N-acyltransferase